MSLQEWKNNEINRKLMKKWGLLKEDIDGSEDDDPTSGEKELLRKAKAGEAGEWPAHVDPEEEELARAKQGKRGEWPAQGKISVREAKEITRRIMERFRKEYR